MRGDFVNLNIKVFNKHRSGLIAKCLEIPHYAYSSRCVSYRKKQPHKKYIWFLPSRNPTLKNKIAVFYQRSNDIERKELKLKTYREYT